MPSLTFVGVQFPAPGFGLNVKAFPYLAKGDGITDDTLAIQTAENDAEVSGSSLVFPPGNYKITSPIIMAKPVDWMGAVGSPASGSFFGSRVFTAAAINLVNVNIAGSGNEDAGGTFMDLLFDGTFNGLIGLNFTGSTNTKILLVKVEVIKCKTFGAYYGGNHSIHHLACTFALNGNSTATTGGVEIDGANAVHFWGCNLEANKGSGLIYINGYTSSFRDGVIEGNDYHGVYGFSAGGKFPQHMHIENIDFEQNGASGGANLRDINIADAGSAWWTIRGTRHTDTVPKTDFAIFSAGDFTRVEAVRSFNQKFKFTFGNGSIVNVDGASIDASSFPLGANVERSGTGITGQIAGTFNGTGAQTQFTLAHGLVSTPYRFFVFGQSVDASGDYYLTVDATNVYVNYKVAPPNGVNNVVLRGYASV